MTAGEARVRQAKFVVFQDAPTDEERLAAVLVTRDPDTGATKVYTKDVPGRPQPDPEIVAMLAQSVALQNL